MTRNDFLQRIARAGWCAYDLNPNWIRVSRCLEYTSPDDGPINPMATIDIVQRPESDIHLLLPTRHTGSAGAPLGTLAWFRVEVADWAAAWALVEKLYQQFAPLTAPFHEVVVRVVPSNRLTPDDGSFMHIHGGPVPLEWKLVEPILGE